MLIHELLACIHTNIYTDIYGQPQVCYVIGYIKVFIPSHCHFLSSHIFLLTNWLSVFARRAAVLGLISSMRLDGKMDIQSVKLAWSVFLAELRVRIQNLLLVKL